MEATRIVNEIRHELGIAKVTFYNWHKKYAGTDSQQVKRLKELEKKRITTKIRVDNKLTLLDRTC
ncbi:MAG: hypothetical protein HRU40_13215 [Saprospiraceae bacterium]|nr:hypothetical protein [Saprospiraceae bacterium]